MTEEPMIPLLPLLLPPSPPLLNPESGAEKRGARSSRRSATHQHRNSAPHLLLNQNMAGAPASSLVCVYVCVCVCMKSMRVWMYRIQSAYL